MINNPAPDPDRTVLLSLSNPNDATLGTPVSATLTITDDDPTVQFNDATYAVDEDEGAGGGAVHPLGVVEHQDERAGVLQLAEHGQHLGADGQGIGVGLGCSASQQAAAAPRRLTWSAPQSSRTVITPVVRVPVLSVQMTVALPRVSTAGSFRINAWRAAIRCTPIASAIVTIAGSPSGTAATASETADMKTSSQRWPRRRPIAATVPTMPIQTKRSVRPTVARRF